MNVVHKRQFSMLQTAGVFDLPVGAEVVGFDFQQGVGTFWYARGESDGIRSWEMQIVGTGHSYDDKMSYLAGPAMMEGFVFHLVGRRL